jgi:hypothetical protein
MQKDVLPDSQQVPVPGELRHALTKPIQRFDKLWVAVVIAQQVVELAVGIHLDQTLQPSDAIFNGMTDGQLGAPSKVKNVSAQHKSLRPLDC